MNALDTSSLPPIAASKFEDLGFPTKAAHLGKLRFFGGGEGTSEKEDYGPTGLYYIHRSKLIPTLKLLVGTMCMGPAFGRTTESFIPGHRQISILTELASEGHVTVSPRLLVSREALLEQNLLAPSGAYLSWLEMIENERADDAQKLLQD